VEHEEVDTPLALRALRHRWWLVVLIALIAGGAAYAVSSSTKRDFSTSADILVTPIAADDATFLAVPALRQTGDTARIVQTAVGLIDTPTAARIAARELGGKWTQGSVGSAVDVQARGASNLVEVTARAEKARDARRLANAYARGGLEVRRRALVRPLRVAVRQAYAQLRRQGGRRSGYADQLRARIDNLRVAQATGDPSLSLSRLATLPTSRSGPPTWLVVAAALVAGAALGFVLALLLEAIRPRRRPAGGA
jgi:capsular polysaccharide biosynthesis protein